MQKYATHCFHRHLYSRSVLLTHSCSPLLVKCMLPLELLVQLPVCSILKNQKNTGLQEADSLCQLIILSNPKIHSHSICKHETPFVASFGLYSMCLCTLFDNWHNQGNKCKWDTSMQTNELNTKISISNHKGNQRSARFPENGRKPWTSWRLFQQQILRSQPYDYMTTMAYNWLRTLPHISGYIRSSISSWIV
jgi:hypothetical protein